MSKINSDKQLDVIEESQESLYQENDLQIKLQLGDIIKFDAPSNEELNDKIFFIKFINTKKIVFVNNEKTINIDISDDGKLLEESIINILLLNRHESPSFVVQNNLEMGKLLSIYFRGEIAIVVNGVITSIENDMIEITTIPNNELLYIDFEYSGIPEKLNIEKIVVKDKIDESKKLLDSLVETKDINQGILDEDDSDKLQEGDFILDDKYELDNDLKAYDTKEILDEIVLDTLDIGTQLDEIEHEINVPENEIRYSLDKQLNDYLDVLINKFLPEERTDDVVNQINMELNRYKQLRTIYSKLDDKQNIEMVPIKSDYYKPLKDLLKNLNKKLYWVLPVSSNVRKIIINNDEIDEEQDSVIIETVKDYFESLDDIIMKWSTNTSKEKINSYKDYISNLLQILDNNIVASDEKLKVNSQINVVNNVLDDFYTYAVKDDTIKKSRFVFDVFNEAMNMLESYYFENKKLYKFKRLVEADFLSVISFITLPLPIFNFSKINHDYTSIYDKANLNYKFLNYSKFLNNTTNINSFKLMDDSNADKFKESDETINQDDIVKAINNYELNNYNDKSYLEKIDDLLESFISTKKVFIEKYNKLQLELDSNHNHYTLNKILYNIQPYNIDLYNINYRDYLSISNILNENIKQYKTNQKNLLSELTKIVDQLNSQHKEKKSDDKYKLDLLNDQLNQDLLTYYKIDETNICNNEELLSCFIKIDGATFLMDSVNKHIMDLLVGNLLDNFIKNHQEASQELIESQENELNKKCKTYFLSKKYNNQQEIDNDNDKLIYFDSIYDTTFYSLINKFKTESETMDQLEFVEFLTPKIQEMLSLSNEDAKREAIAIVNQKREVQDNDYGLYQDKETGKNIILIRRDNKWVIDEKFTDQFMINSNKIICDFDKDCISEDDKCLNLETKKLKDTKQDIDNIIKNFNSKYDLSIEELKGKINDKYDRSLKYLDALFKIKEKQEKKHNQILLKYDEVYDDNKYQSPYSKLCDEILGIKDFTLRQTSIKKFCLLYTREAIKEENSHWLYCIVTGLKLIPLFLLKLANSFLNREDYLLQLDTICADQGTISDDNNYWVDKHSGYIIKRIDFNTEEGFDEKGYTLQTRSLIESEYDVKDDQNDISNDSTTKMIKNIIKTMIRVMAITLNENQEFIINNVILLLKTSLVSESDYKKMMEKKKDDKAKQKVSYEDYVNTTLLFLTLAFLILVIQVNIPSVKTRKTFPTCKKSFSGYPLDGEQDKTTINYIACIVNKIKKNIKPWNTVLKLSESSIAKKLESIIQKYIINDKKSIELMNKKKEYLLYAKDEEIPESVSLNMWSTFMPSLQDIKIAEVELTPISDGFQKILFETFTQGKKNTIEEMINSKIIYLANSIIESIQNVVKKNVLLLENSNGEPFLQNACCNDENNTINFFHKNDKSIIEKNNLSNYYRSLLTSINLLKSASVIYHPISTKKIILKSINDYDYNETTIYRAFIVFCNFNNLLPIDENLKEICLDKPENYDENLNLSETIESLKSQGKIYNKDLFLQLITLVNRKNIVNFSLDNTVVNNIELLREIIEDYHDKTDMLLDSNFFDKINELLDTYEITKKEKEDKPIKNYLGQSIALMKKKIIEYIKKLPSFNEKESTEFIESLEFNLDLNNLDFYKNYIFKFLYVFPYIVLNKSINYGAIPKHWDLSEKHIQDIFNITEKYYNNFMAMNAPEEFKLVLSIVQSKCKIIIDIINVLVYNEPIKLEEGNVIQSIFDERLIKLIYNYFIYSIIIEFISYESDEEFQREILNYEGDDKLENLQKTINNYLFYFMTTMKKHSQLVDNSYKKLKEKISYAKEKEKDLITEYLQDLTDEEREIENIFKQNKLEKWSKGLQKGLTQYVKENYDEERLELEKQALKEKKLDKNSEVTDMNRELYDLDMVEQETLDKIIEKEEYDMNGIPDDDDMDGSDYEYD